MRYFVAGFALLAVLVVGVLGFRGDLKRKPPLQIFPDMKVQPKLHPQSSSAFFADGMSSRPPVPGTIARGEPYSGAPENTGRIAGTTNFVENIPVPVTEQLMTRGRQRYEIFCLPCHGATADGKGIMRQFGMAVVANLHDKRIVMMPDGEIFNIITHGKNLMGAYGATTTIEDRWAVIAYLRALQWAQLGLKDDVPAAVLPTLK